MTIETCKKRYDLAKARGNEKEAHFWKERALKKSKNPKYKDIDVNNLFGFNVEGKADGKKSKR